MSNIVLLIARCLIWIGFNSRLIQTWYRLYQYIWQRNTRDPVPLYRNFSEMYKVINKCQWSADSWRELWDAVSNPQHVQFLINRGERYIGDCDEFGVYQAAAFSDAIFKREFEDKDLVEACLLTIMWQSSTFKFGGHNVCGLRWQHTDGSIEYGYVDYDLPIRNMHSWEEVVRSVIDRYSTRWSSKIGYARHTPYQLKMIEYKV